MRPARFITFLAGLCANDPQITAVQSLEDAGVTRHPYGLVLTCATGARTLLQAVVTSPDGDRFDQPEQIIEGDAPPAEIPVPDLYDGGKLQLASVDKYLAALITNSGSREITTAEPFSSREKPGAVRYGVKTTFHSKARIYLYVVHALPAGHDSWPTKATFEVPATV